MWFNPKRIKPMDVHFVASKTEVERLNTEELRSRFLFPDLFVDGEIRLKYCDMDRVIVGAACPAERPLSLDASDELRASCFCERRELGVINIGESGMITADGIEYAVGNRECLYIGRGTESISFASSAGKKALFYLISYPAHTRYPTTKATIDDARKIELGASEFANERVIYQYIHEAGIKSCQLVMGFTVLKEGSVWNTMPAHTHNRRSEVYLYFDVPEGNTVFHFMGEPQQTRHLCVGNRQAVLSPAWSIHSGCGTGDYTFIWAMGGENQRFDDMDPAPIDLLR
jgi:4-deoxy-L-threo-5-hexosulose-uronate ketol-isomerase